MSNLIALISIITSLMSPVDIKPSYYQEYDLVGETPNAIVVSAYEERLIPTITMPEIVVTAPAKAENSNSINFPEVIVTAPAYAPSNGTQDVYMMPNIVVKANRYIVSSADIKTSRPNPNFDYSQSPMKYFYLYAILSVLGVIAYAGIRVCVPRTIFRPISIAVNRIHLTRNNHHVPRKRI